MTTDYNIELNNILNKIYQYKAFQIALKNNFLNICSKDSKNYLNILKNTKIYLGNDMEDFIKNLIPKGKDGYIFRLKVAKHHNYSYPKIFDHKGNLLKNITTNKLAYQLWEAHMDELLINDISQKFNQDNFIEFLDNNFDDIINDINLYIKKSNSEKSVTIPFKKGDDLVKTVKSMILDKKLDFNWVHLLIDMDKVREDMIKWSIAFDMYNEFDKLEDELENCLNKFFKYDSVSLYDFLVNEKNFKYIDDIGLVYN